VNKATAPPKVLKNKRHRQSRTVSGCCPVASSLVGEGGGKVIFNPLSGRGSE